MATNVELDQKVNDLSEKIDRLVNVMTRTTPDKVPDDIKEKPVEETYIPTGYKDAVEKILGPEFQFEIGMVEDQEMVIITVPEKYRPKGISDAYISDFKSKRVGFKSSLEQRDDIKQIEIDDKMAEYDERHKEMVPPDKRSRAMATLKTIVDFRKWLLLMRDNIKKELETVKVEAEVPTDSLQDELNI